MSELFTVFGNILRMCRDRGYEIDAEVEQKYEEERAERARGNNAGADRAPGSEASPVYEITSILERGKQGYGVPILFEKFLRGERELVLVFFAGRADSPKVKLEFIDTAILAMAEKREIREAVIVVDRPLSTEAQKSILRLTPTVRIQVFLETELMFLAVDHVLTPKYEKIPDNEVQALLDELRVKKTNLPVVRRSDPICKYYNWPAGSVVRVIRELFLPDFLAPICVNYAQIK